MAPRCSRRSGFRSPGDAHAATPGLVSTKGKAGVAPQTAREAILDAATKLFSERSPSTVSLREIACVAGVNYGLIHHYFGTKEALLGDVFARFSERSARQLDEATTIEEAVRQFAP